MCPRLSAPRWLSCPSQLRAVVPSRSAPRDPRASLPDRRDEGARLNWRRPSVVRARVATHRRGTAVSTNHPLHLAVGGPWRYKLFALAAVLVIAFGYDSRTSLDTLNLMSVLAPI